MIKIAAVLLVIAMHTDGRVIVQETEWPDMATCERIAATINEVTPKRLESPWQFDATCSAKEIKDVHR